MTHVLANQVIYKPIMITAEIFCFLLAIEKDNTQWLTHMIPNSDLKKSHNTGSRKKNKQTWHPRS